MKKRYRLLKTSPWWRYISYALAGLVLLPVLTVAASWFLPGQENWQHIVDNLLWRLIGNSVVLLLGVILGTALIGISLAWFVSQYQFPGRKWLARLLLFPLALPAYVTGFVYIGLLDFSGPLASQFRSWGLPAEFWFEVRSTWGIVAVLSLSLYPYVYLIMKTAFESQGRQIIEAARSLGMPMPKIFLGLAVPLALPWLIGSLSLVAMETLADFGTVSIFVYDTFTTAIYRSWYGLFSPTTAAQLASLLIVPIMLLYALDQWIKKRQSYVTSSNAPSRLVRLPKRQAWLISLYCVAVLSIALLIPMIQLMLWAAGQLPAVDWQRTLLIAKNSALLGGVTGLTVGISASILVYSYRFFQVPKLLLVNRLATIGYALPGAVLAIGVYLPLTWLDRGLGWTIESLLQRDVGLIFTGSMVAMVLGLSIRFIAVAHAAIFAGQQRVSSRLDEAAVNHGVYGVRQLWLVHLPLIRAPLATAFILVFVDVIKEMPLTLMTRPFGWDTLSVRIFEFISEGEWERASIPALLMVLVSVVPVLILDRKESYHGSHRS